MIQKDTIVIDVDGCLNHYPNPLKMWAEMTLNLDQSASKEAIKIENDFDLIKNTYRHSKILSYLLPRNGTAEVLQKMKKHGYRVVLLTARNPKKNPHIKDITKHWLDRYCIPYDDIVFTREKAPYIQQYGNRIVMIIEDEPKFLDLFKKMKTEVVAFSNEINGGLKQSHFHMVSSWIEIDSLFERLIAK